MDHAIAMLAALTEEEQALLAAAGIISGLDLSYIEHSDIEHIIPNSSIVKKRKLSKMALYIARGWTITSTTTHQEITMRLSSSPNVSIPVTIPTNPSLFSGSPNDFDKWEESTTSNEQNEVLLTRDTQSVKKSGGTNKKRKSDESLDQFHNSGKFLISPTTCSPKSTCAIKQEMLDDESNCYESPKITMCRERSSELVTLIQAALNNPKNPEIQEKACKRIVSCDNEEEWDMVRRNEGIEMVVACIKHNYTNLDVVIEAHRALGHIAFHDETNASADRIAECEGIEAVIMSLTNPKLKLIKPADRKIIVESGFKDSLVHIINSTLCVQKFVKRGGIEAIFHLMKIYQTSDKIQGFGCDIICDLSFHEKYALQKLCDEDVISTIVQSICAKTKKTDIKVKAFRALHNFIDKVPNGKEAFADCKEALCRMMKFLSIQGNFGKEILDGKKVTCHVLALVVVPIPSEAMKKVVDAGALKATIVMMKQFPRNWEEEHSLLMNILDYLARIHCEPEAFIKLGAGEAVISSMKKCALVSCVQSNGCKALSTFVGTFVGPRDDVDNVCLLKDKKVCVKAIKIVAEAMSQFPDDARVNIEGCIFFFCCTEAFLDVLNETLRDIQPKSSDVLKNAEFKFGQQLRDEYDENEGSIKCVRSLIESDE